MSSLVVYTNQFKKYYRKLPDEKKRKFDKQIKRILRDFNHPSLHTKKIKGSEGFWEARVDYSHRFIFAIEGNTITLQAVGPHDILKSFS